MDTSSEFQREVLACLDSFYSYAVTLARRADEAEDLLQEALVRGFKGFSSFDRSLNFKPWMFAIIKNVHIDRLRRGAARVPEAGIGPDDGAEGLSADDALCSVPLAPEDILIRRETIEQVRDAIRSLPGALREVVELRDMEGLSYQEIAHVIQRPPGTVMSRLYRGRNLVRTYLVERQQGRDWARIRHGL